MRDPIHVLKSLEEKASVSNYKYERLYRNLYNPEFFLLAYANIAKSQGSMTQGVDGQTLDNMSLPRINRIIESLRNKTYQPQPAKRKYIPKKNGKLRPLGITSTDDKLVQEVVRMILEAIYEPTFSNNSHGFRPKRSCHTALAQVKKNFTGAIWIVEGDIKACFDNFDHHVLTDLLRKRISDESFIGLIWKFLKAGYMEQWQYNCTYSGVPQGSGISPICANIYLSELDKFMQEYKELYDCEPVRRKTTKEYERASRRYKKARKALMEAEESTPELVKEFKDSRKEKMNQHYHDPFEAGFKKIQYNRYADDFVIGVIGSKKDAEKIKEDVKNFLKEKLHLDMSEEKTKVTHSSESVRYLGYDFKVIQITLISHLEKFNLTSLAGITQTDEMELGEIGERKTAVFAVIPDSDSSYNFIVGMLYTQLFQQLYRKADFEHGGRLPVHVHFVMDEFANVALPDDFDKLLATMRSREISVSIILQNLAQLKALFDKQWESIVGNCDTFLYLGGNEQSTHEYVSKLLGKQTIDTNTYGQSKGRSGSYTTNFQTAGRELMTPDEVRMLDNRYALLFIRGERPVKDLKYNILKHPNVALTTDGQAAAYQHGTDPLSVAAVSINLEKLKQAASEDTGTGDYVVLTEEEVYDFMRRKAQENNQNQNSNHQEETYEKHHQQYHPPHHPSYF